mmetsp:Transcript_26950/g.53974  ORF Transcript_26950/g.53974 Transcript_26950/m.53974 type:complete len:94 (+) Transcript_26950:1037-1318(+)
MHTSQPSYCLRVVIDSLFYFVGDVMWYEYLVSMRCVSSTKVENFYCGRKTKKNVQKKISGAIIYKRKDCILYILMHHFESCIDGKDGAVLVSM